MLRATGMELRAALRRERLNTRALGRGLFAAAGAALTALVQLKTGIAPFAPAFLTGALAAGLNPVLLALGSLAGAFSDGAPRIAVPLSACAVIAGWWLYVQATEHAAGRRERTSSAGARRDAAVSLLAGLGALISGLLLRQSDLRAMLYILVSVTAAAASAPFFRAVSKVTPERRHLMPEERLGMILFGLTATAGLHALWPPLGMIAACVSALVAAGLGPGAGACAGLGGGGALILSGGGAYRCAALGLCGMLAGLAPGRKRCAAAAVLCASFPVVLMLTGGAWTDFVCVPAACAAALAIPEGWMNCLRSRLGGERLAACDPDRLARRLRAESEVRLRALSEAFGELSDGYRIPVDVPDEQSLIAEMRAQLCDGCPNYAQCWVEGDNRTVRFLCQLISEAVDWAAGDRAEPLFADEPAPDVLRQCRRGRTIPARLGGLLEEFAGKRRAEMKRGAVNQLISAQFMQAQMLLGGLADAQAKPLKIRGQQAARARAALDREGIETSDVMALRGQRRMEIVAALKQGRWTPELARRAAESLSRTFGRSYVPAEEACGAELKFRRLPPLRATASAGCHSCRAGVPSGDSHGIRMLGDDRIALMLSDGMGSGEAAARESAQTLRLLSRFLAADVHCQLALETVNELMLARSESDMFATVDVCLIDLAAGVAEFTKLAACRSLILRRGEVIAVEGGRLPLGILEKVQPSVTRMEISAGDVIIMASDGVMDAVPPQALSAHLLANTHQPPNILAESILTLAEKYQSRRDDMTVVAARVAERRACRAERPEAS